MSERDELKREIARLEHENAELLRLNHDMNKRFLEACERNIRLERLLEGVDCADIGGATL